MCGPGLAAHENEHAAVELKWPSDGGGFVVEKRHKSKGEWETVAKNAKSPVVDAKAECGETLYRVPTCPLV